VRVIAALTATYAGFLVVGCRYDYEVLPYSEAAGAWNSGGLSADDSATDAGASGSLAGANSGGDASGGMMTPSAGSTATGGSGTGGSVTSSGGGSAGAAGTSIVTAGSGGTFSTGGTTTIGGAAGAGGTPSTGGTSACSNGTNPLQIWSFDGDLEGWTWVSDSGASGAIRWSSTVGNPTPGSVQFDAASGSGVMGDILYTLATPADLSGRTLCAWVMLESGSAVSVNFIAATTLVTTALGPSTPLTPGSWTCVSFEPDAPESAPDGYDPTSIRWIGLQPWGGAPFRIYVDQIAY